MKEASGGIFRVMRYAKIQLNPRPADILRFDNRYKSAALPLSHGGIKEFSMYYIIYIKMNNNLILWFFTLIV